MINTYASDNKRYFNVAIKRLLIFIYFWQRRFYKQNVYIFNKTKRMNDIRTSFIVQIIRSTVCLFTLCKFVRQNKSIHSNLFPKTNSKINVYPLYIYYYLFSCSTGSKIRHFLNQFSSDNDNYTTKHFRHSLSPHVSIL